MRAARAHDTWGGPRDGATGPRGPSALPGPPPPPCRRGLELPGRAGLDVMPPLAKLLEQSGLLHLALEEFERVLQAIALVEPNLYHAALPLG